MGLFQQPAKGKSGEGPACRAFAALMGEGVQREYWRRRHTLSARHENILSRRACTRHVHHTFYYLYNTLIIKIKLVKN
jgi:hypothetical protein